MTRIRKRDSLIFIGVVLIMPLIVQSVPAIEHYLEILIFAGIYTLISLGMSLLMGFAGQISLGHAAFFGIGAYMSAVLTSHYEMNSWLVMLLAMVTSVVIAVLVGLPTLKLKGHYLAMATLAFGIVVYIVFNEETEITGGPDGMGDIPPLSLGDFTFEMETHYYYLVWGMVILAYLFSVNLIQSRVGRCLRSIHDSELAARCMGINVAKYKVQIFALSAAWATLAGSLLAHYMNFVNPSTFDLMFSVKLVIMIMLGGMYSLWGAITGAVLVTFLSFEWLEAFEDFETIVFGSILLVVTIFLPEGLISLFPKMKRLIGASKSTQTVQSEAVVLKTEG